MVLCVGFLPSGQVWRNRKWFGETISAHQPIGVLQTLHLENKDLLCHNCGADPDPGSDPGVVGELTCAFLVSMWYPSLRLVRTFTVHRLMWILYAEVKTHDY